MAGRQILDMNAFDAHAPHGFDAALEARLAARAARFGAASVLFYDEPLEFTRGAGCRLYTADGTPYLDAYNNVPSVGHCHPHVVDCVARQLGALNVHNRYLHPGILEYAERLAATLPPDLGTLTFTCTGSESNDLALRLAANFTGARGIIVTEAAYHGNTALVTGVSPTLCRDGLPSSDVRCVPAPYGASSSGGFAAAVAAAIADLQASGAGVAALLVDSIFSSDGVHPDPPGFLRAAVDAVHGAGGLFIADEVQCGFGRTGAGWWGFARHGVAPDVVTFGKPMGNGYPVAAVATRPAILEAFCARCGYFNTFAGTPAAAAAANAVFDVIEREGLIENARRVGDGLKADLERLARRHEAIAQVRGVGLYIGVELAAPRDGSGAAQAAKRMVNELRRRQVLIGTAGRDGNVLKIRPPLCFDTADAAQLLGALEAVLSPP